MRALTKWLARLFKKPDPQVDAFLAMLRAYFPPITIEQHKQAIERLEIERAKETLIRLPDGETIPFRSGVVRMDDLRAESGYAVCVSLAGQTFDRFGWPEGDQNSPARLYD